MNPKIVKYFKDTASRFTRINRAHAKRMGIKDPREAIGKTDLDFYPEEFAQETYADEQEIMRTGQSLVNKIERIRMKDRGFHCVSATKVPIKDREGRITGIVGISRDITERKKVEEELKKYTEHLEELVEERTRELREAERMAAIGELAAMVGHDLRNPLQAITNAVYILKESAKEVDSTLIQYTGILDFLPKHIREQVPPYVTKVIKERDEMVRIIDESVNYANKIISDLQDYATPVKPKFVPTSLDQLINDALSTMKIPETVKVSVVAEEGFPQLVVDPILMRRVFTNLITNALQAMPDGGRLTIRASKIEEAALISIEDTGVGISKEDMNKLFHPLFTTKAKGIGLGLAVCQRLVEAHGGTITAESEVGKGSTFIVKIPLRKEVN